MSSITNYFYHQNSPKPSDLTPAQPVTWKFAFSTPLTIGHSGKLIAVSHSFRDVKRYDFWLQAEVDGHWIDMPETGPFLLYQPFEVKGDHVPRNATAPKMFRFTDLPEGLNVRAITTRIEGTKNKKKSGVWGVSMTTGTIPVSHPRSPYLT